MNDAPSVPQGGALHGDAADRVEPRYEFRVFAPDLCLLEMAIRRRASMREYVEGAETYLLTAHDPDLSIKIRHRALELKALLRRDRGLQLWRPEFHVDFPATAAELFDVLDNFIAADEAQFDGRVWEPIDLVRRFNQSVKGGAVVTLFKKRWRFDIDDCAAEIVEVLVNGARLMSAAVEATDPEAVLLLRETLGLAQQENVSYVRALERLLGRAPMADDAFYGSPLL